MWSHDVVAALRGAFIPLADPERSGQMQAYMKDVAPFLGLSAPTRRQVQRRVFAVLPTPTETQVVEAAHILWAQPEREYSYAAGDLLGRYVRLLAPVRLDSDVRRLLVSRPWWDTVDVLGSQVITPMVNGHRELRAVMWDWNATTDQWLIRASIQHQRGLRAATDVPLLLDLCEPHVTDSRFFVAKAIGWALRDTCRFDAAAVARWVDVHPELSAVARREARKGISRALG